MFDHMGAQFFVCEFEFMCVHVYSCMCVLFSLEVKVVITRPFFLVEDIHRSNDSTSRKDFPSFP